MNSYRVMGIALIVFTSLNLHAQKGTLFPKSSYIEPYRLEVTLNKTSNLVFPDAIASIDRGSQDIIVQKADGVENILRIKAVTKVFEETNLSVITKDGKLYSFIVGYNSNPPYLNINVSGNYINGPSASVSESMVPGTLLPQNEGTLRNFTNKALEAKPNIYGVWERNSKMYLELNGFYVNGNTMYCRLTIQNFSAIDYNIDQLRLYIRYKKISKRTASQETELMPLHVLGDTSVIAGRHSETITVAIPKFTIPDGKYLMGEIMEKSGGRNLSLRVKNRHVMRARVLPNK